MRFRQSLWGLALIVIAAACWGDVNVYFGSSAPAGTQTTFLENTLSQCTTTYYAPNTFANSFDLILSSCAAGNGLATTPEPDYIYGWADGATYNQYQQSLYVGDLSSACMSTSTSTFLVFGTTGTYDTQISSQTCMDVINTIGWELYQLYTSTPTVIPGGF